MNGGGFGSTATGVGANRDASWKNQSGVRNEKSSPKMDSGTEALCLPGRYAPRFNSTRVRDPIGG